MLSRVSCHGTALKNVYHPRTQHNGRKRCIPAKIGPFGIQKQEAYRGRV